MKKYLLGLLAIPFGFIAFSNAETINFSCNDGFCSPDTINISTDNCIDGYIQFSVNNFSCSDESECGLNITNDAGDNWYSIVYENGILVDNSCYVNGNETLLTVLPANADSSVQMSINIINSNSGGGVISDGFGSFTPVITGIKDTIFQLIPLVIYIGIGVLISILGFYAIRWLVNWIGGKINSYFNSKRD